MNTASTSGPGDRLLSDDPGAGFQGTIGRTLHESTPWWAPRQQPRAGAPNVIIVLLDDLGYSDFGCFGAEIATPNIDALAAGGLRFANYTTVPMCTPARAASTCGPTSCFLAAPPACYPHRCCLSVRAPLSP